MLSKTYSLFPMLPGLDETYLLHVYSNKSSLTTAYYKKPASHADKAYLSIVEKRRSRFWTQKTMIQAAVYVFYFYLLQFTAEEEKSMMNLWKSYGLASLLPFSISLSGLANSKRALVLTPRHLVAKQEYFTQLPQQASCLTNYLFSGSLSCTSVSWRRLYPRTKNYTLALSLKHRVLLPHTTAFQAREQELRYLESVKSLC